MKKILLIEVGDDIDLDFLQKNCKHDGLTFEIVPEYKAIANGKVLSDMTNKAVIQTMFPNLRELKMVLENEDGEDYEVKYDLISEDVSEDWLNAPYKD